ncbi:protein of unknown function [Paenibacillaceae bacterium GAS479]|nr:protein of unknown function [Paenibacillaceae bacterium GAS479]
MPFTFSHPLFAAPLNKLVPRLSIMGLALGSMAPDMEYFIAMEPYRSIGHEWQGFLLLGLPLSIACSAAFYSVLAPLLPRLLPSIGSLDRYAADRLSKTRLRAPASVSAWGWFLLSLYIGYLSHLFMDGMTHTNGWLVVRNTELMYERTAGLPTYRWLQYLFSLLGLLVYAIWLAFDYGRWRRVRSKTAQAVSPALASFEPSAFRSHRPLDKLALWFCASCVGLILLAPKIMFSEHPDNLVLWLVAGLSSALFGFFSAGLLLNTPGKGRFIRAVGLLLLLVFAALFKASAIVREATSSPYEAGPIGLWIGYIWVFSILVWVLSSSGKRRQYAAVQPVSGSSSQRQV